LWRVYSDSMLYIKTNWKMHNAPVCDP
jgi:hypothetical protein